MNRRRMLQACAWLAGAGWLSLAGCSGMGTSGCGANPNADIQPDCPEGYYANQNSDGSYTACQPIPKNPGTTTSGP